MPLACRMAHPAGSSNSDAKTSLRPFIPPQSERHQSSGCMTLPETDQCPDQVTECQFAGILSEFRDTVVSVSLRRERVNGALHATLRVPMSSLRSQLRGARARRGAACVSGVPLG